MPITQSRIAAPYGALGFRTPKSQNTTHQLLTWRDKHVHHISRDWFIGRMSLKERYKWLSPPQTHRRARNIPVPVGRSRAFPGGIPVNIQEQIDASKWILELKVDWDDEGSPGYSEMTWDLAVEFLIRLATFARQVSQKEIPAPSILPGPNASIDLHWKIARFELLVNVPPDPSQPATFYGDDFGKLCVRGNFNASEPSPFLAFWLLS